MQGYKAETEAQKSCVASSCHAFLCHSANLQSESSLAHCSAIFLIFSLPNHTANNIMVLLPVEKWINKVNELFTKINSLTTQGQCSSQETMRIKMFINNRTKLLIKLPQLVLLSCPASNTAFFQGISGPLNIFYSTPVFLRIFSATISAEKHPLPLLL